MTVTKKWVLALLLYFPAHFVIQGVMNRIYMLIANVIWRPYDHMFFSVLYALENNLIIFLFYLLIFTVLEILNNDKKNRGKFFFKSKESLIITLIVTVVSGIMNDVALPFTIISLTDIIGMNLLGICLFAVLESAIWVLSFAVIYCFASEAKTSEAKAEAQTSMSDDAGRLFVCIRQMFSGKKGLVAIVIIAVSIIFYVIYVAMTLAAAERNMYMMGTGSLITYVSMLSGPRYSPNMFLMINLGCIIAASKTFIYSKPE